MNVSKIENVSKQKISHDKLFLHANIDCDCYDTTILLKRIFKLNLFYKFINLLFNFVNALVVSFFVFFDS